MEIKLDTINTFEVFHELNSTSIVTPIYILYSNYRVYLLIFVIHIFITMMRPIYNLTCIHN